ncbi:hypothetical protein M422DRAFT_193561 [Sphaerobolus stellatus SS14]|uniref:3-oxoacyl-[acyl-carrier-protein] reductase n=1 Tax=Sphaerobolus stellatus (strain SS14) TaxID=990650 RepID=A0A0C9U8K4_SPHS4|nr:hypothetical protein M422DRAFT_193561 [Sphaerobolus stellatus SS14]
MDVRLKDINILVTSAAGMIDLAIAQLFLEQGTKVVAHYNITLSTLQPLQEKYVSQLILVQANLTSESAVSALFEQLTTIYNFQTQILVLNHGYWPTTDVPMVDMTLEQWESTTAINLTSNFILAKGYLKELWNWTESQKEFCVDYISGKYGGKVGEANHSDYAVAKSAMMYRFTLSLKNEIVNIAPRGRVNCVAPGWVKTAVAKEALDHALILILFLRNRTPLKKFARPEHVTHQIVILASPILSGHISREVVVVAGGMEGC